jgi:hypothetical protein
MSALILLGVMAIWVALGWLLWKALFQRRVRGKAARNALAAAFLAAWGIAPWADEILGAMQFDRACAAIQPIKFSGPVSVGAGPFFDEAGRPKWRTGDEFSSIYQRTRAFDQLFEQRDAITQLARWPIPITLRRNQYFVRSTGAQLIEDTSLTSPGGWLKRNSGWGTHAPYQCPAKGGFVPEEQWIKF